MILVHVTTVPETFTFFRGQIAFMKRKGFQVHGVSSPGPLLKEVAIREHIPVHAVDLPRRISPWVDSVALFKLYRLFRNLQPDIVHAHTPKGGLLGVLAARLARVPVVIYSMRGLPFVTATGLKRRLLCWSETVSCGLADRVISVGFSLLEKGVAAGFCNGDKIKVLASGSSNGVDAEGRFNPQRLEAGSREKTRLHYRLPQDAIVLGFMGRIVRDKGLVELAAAWRFLREVFPELFLLLVGPVEDRDPVPPEVLKHLEADPRVRLVGAVGDPAPFYAAMDILTLPTYREGFPNTPLEAAAMELPVVATDVDGCVEAVMYGLTGLLVPPRDSKALAAALQQLIEDPELRKQMGQAGRRRVLREFKPENIWKELYQEYRDLLGCRSTL